MIWIDIDQETILLISAIACGIALAIVAMSAWFLIIAAIDKERNRDENSKRD